MVSIAHVDHSIKLQYIMVSTIGPKPSFYIFGRYWAPIMDLNRTFNFFGLFWLRSQVFKCTNFCNFRPILGTLKCLIQSNLLFRPSKELIRYLQVPIFFLDRVRNFLGTFTYQFSEISPFRCLIQDLCRPKKIFRTVTGTNTDQYVPICTNRYQYRVLYF